MQHRKTKPCPPRTNGMVERFNGRVQREVLGITLYSHRDLEIVLRGFSATYNGRRQRVLNGFSPEMLLLRRRLEADPTLTNPAFRPPWPPECPARRRRCQGGFTTRHRLKHLPSSRILKGRRSDLHAAHTNMRRFVASFMLAVIAMFAVLSSAHAGLHASGHSHGSSVVRAETDGGSASLHRAELADQGDVAAPDMPDCSYCHASTSTLALELRAGLVLRGPGTSLPHLTSTVLPGMQPEGLRRPPRLL